MTHAHGVLLTLSYDGAALSGWAKQNNARTVQGELEGAIAVVDPKASTTRGVSRTDAGVHAEGQLVAFDTTRDIDARGWVLALNRELPDEIAVLRSARVPVTFEPRRHVRWKQYCYRVLASPTRRPLTDRYAWRVPYRLNQLAMQAAADTLLGEHDFRAFRGSADARMDTVRRLLRIDVTPPTHATQPFEIRVVGDRFLYNMVRIIAGTLVDIGRGRLPIEACARALDTGLRGDLGITAPAHGLCLESIELDETGEAPWP